MTNIPKISENVRLSIAEFLPDALERALDSYRIFVGDSAFGHGKNFSEHHRSAKTAIGHLELLLKLGRLANLFDPAEA